MFCRSRIDKIRHQKRKRENGKEGRLAVQGAQGEEVDQPRETDSKLKMLSGVSKNTEKKG